MEYKTPFLYELFYSNPYNVLSNGNREYSLQGFDFNYLVEVFVKENAGYTDTYRIVAWQLVDHHESELFSDVRNDQYATFGRQANKARTFYRLNR